jgi:channel protein (hemolysin III family)
MASDSQAAVVPRPSVGEEIANSASHGVGLLVALVTGPLLIARSVAQDKPWGAISAAVYLASIWALYFASTLYHALPPGRTKQFFAARGCSNSRRRVTRFQLP